MFAKFQQNLICLPRLLIHAHRTAVPCADGKWMHLTALCERAWIAFGGRTDGQWVTSCRMGPTKLNFILLPRLIRHSATLPPPFPIPFHRRSQRAGVCSWLTLIACCMMQNTVRKFSIDANVQSLTVNSFVRITQGTGGKWVFGFTVHSLFVCVWDWAARIFLDVRIGNCIIGSWYTAFPGDLFCAAIFPVSIHYRLTEADGSSCCHRVRWQVI